MFIQSYLVFNNVLKMLAQKCILYIVHVMFFFPWKILAGYLSNVFQMLLLVSEYSKNIQK